METVCLLALIPARDTCYRLTCYHLTKLALLLKKEKNERKEDKKTCSDAGKSLFLEETQTN